MNITTRQSKIRKLDKSDPRFIIYDTYVMVPRAGFEISRSMPNSYKQIVTECINNDWLKPVAHVTERELIFMGLTE